MLLAALLPAGCGGKGAQESAPSQRVSGNGFTFAAPSGWSVKRQARLVTASPSGGGAELVSVERFRLSRPYTPRLWPRVVPELDRVSLKLAGELKGTVTARRTVSVAGRRARQYEIAYTSRKTRLTQRLTFVLTGRREYQVSCRWPTEDSGLGRAACATLAFRLS